MNAAGLERHLAGLDEALASGVPLDIIESYSQRRTS
jgi:hypothetical protein